MTEYKNIIIVETNEAGQPTNLRRLEDGDTISNERLNADVRNAADKIDTVETTANQALNEAEGVSATVYDNSGGWGAGGIDPGLLADITEVSVGFGDFSGNMQTSTVGVCSIVDSLELSTKNLSGILDGSTNFPNTLVTSLEVSTRNLSAILDGSTPLAAITDFESGRIQFANANIEVGDGKQIINDGSTASVSFNDNVLITSGSTSVRFDSTLFVFEKDGDLYELWDKDDFRNTRVVSGDVINSLRPFSGDIQTCTVFISGVVDDLETSSRNMSGIVDTNLSDLQTSTRNLSSILDGSTNYPNTFADGTFDLAGRLKVNLNCNSNNITNPGTVDGVDIAARDGILTTTTNRVNNTFAGDSQLAADLDANGNSITNCASVSGSAGVLDLSATFLILTSPEGGVRIGPDRADTATWTKNGIQKAASSYDYSLSAWETVKDNSGTWGGGGGGGIPNPIDDDLDMAGFNIVNADFIKGQNNGSLAFSANDSIQFQCGPYTGGSTPASGDVTIIADNVILDADPHPTGTGLTTPRINLGKGLLLTPTSGVDISGAGGETVDDPPNGAALVYDAAASLFKWVRIGATNIGDGAILENNIADGAVGSDKLATGAAAGNIQTNGLTYLMFPSLPDQRILGNNTGINGTTEQLDGADVRAIINVANGATANTGALADLDTVDTAQIEDNAVTEAKVSSDIITTGTVSSIDHGSIAGLSDDDHTQYIIEDPTTSGRNTIIPTGDFPGITIQATSANTGGLFTIKDDAGDDLFEVRSDGQVEIPRMTSYGVRHPNDGTFYALVGLDSANDRVFGDLLSNTGKRIHIQNSTGDISFESNDDDIIFKNGPLNSEVLRVKSDGSLSPPGNLLVSATGDFTGDVLVQGNIAVTGTVDGRDIAADGTKLDGIEGAYAVGTTAPTSPTGGDLWYNTTDDELYTYDSGRGHWLGAPHYISMGKTTASASGVGHFLYVGHNGTAATSQERGWLVPHDMVITGWRGHTKSTYTGWTIRIDKNSGGTNTTGIVSTTLGAVDTFSDFTLDVDVAAADIIGVACVTGTSQIDNNTVTIKIQRKGA